MPSFVDRCSREFLDEVCYDSPLVYREAPRIVFEGIAFDGDFISFPDDLYGREFLALLFKCEGGEGKALIHQLYGLAVRLVANEGDT